MTEAAPCSLGYESGIITGFASQSLDGFGVLVWAKSQSPLVANHRPYPGALC
jgi:hypothetical protein